MDIRPAQETDIVALVELFQSSIETQASEHYTEAQVEAWSGRATETSFQDFILGPTTFVAVDESGPMGFCGYAKDGHITSLYIRPDCKGQGVGRALLQHVLDRASADGVNAFHAEASAMAIPLFEKLGFEKAGFDHITVGDVKFKRQLMALKDQT
ncbi:MAG: GNAT family N-acetyltransferase [Rhodospirillaceae bacterium]